MPICGSRRANSLIQRFTRDREEELVEKLGRNDPCDSGKRFHALLLGKGPVSTAPSGMIIGGEI
jgi:hypothetical protein